MRFQGKRRVAVELVLEHRGVRVAASDPLATHHATIGVAERVLLLVALEFCHLPGAEQRSDEGE